MQGQKANALTDFFPEQCPHAQDREVPQASGRLSGKFNSSFWLQSCMLCGYSCDLRSLVVQYENKCKLVRLTFVSFDHVRRFTGHKYLLLIITHLRLVISYSVLTAVYYVQTITQPVPGATRPAKGSHCFGRKFPISSRCKIPPPHGM